jgi:putative peptidoglycan lipid II flippase
MFIFSDEIIALLAPGFQGDSSALKNSSMLLKIMSPIIIFISLVALSNGALSCYRIYGKAALAQVVMNISMIAGASFALFTTPENGIILLAVSVTIGAIFQIFVQIPSLRKLEFSILPSLRLFTKSNKEILVLIFPALFGAAIYQMTIVLGTIFASLLPRGSISALFYADRIAQLPLGLISIAVASVLLPILANAESKKDWSATKNELSKSIRFVNFLILPISFYFFMYAQPIVSLLFERGAFTSQDALITSQALQAYCFGLWAVSTHSLLTRVFLAKKDTKTPAIIGLGSLLFYLCSCLLLMGPPSYLEESVFLDSFLLPVQAALSSQFGSLSLGHVGLALSNSITACFSVVLSLLVFYFRSFELDLRPVIRLILSSLVACLAARYVVSVLPSTQPTFIYLSLSAIVFSLVYLVLMLIIRSPEARDLIRIPSIYLHKKLSRGISEK